ncbi:glucose-1-phosphate thymidylyltransferase [Candidatus Gracilibacteria bacterium 28_42_T64]|nr:glucose-1-phosphate thymidylyltransferase [Candidatus Gracilibacteria bacterium 28_42_T64]
MKAIILAAGEGSRLRPFTNTIPKPLIKIMGKTIIEHNLEHIYSHVNEIIIVIKYKAELIKKYFGDNYKGTKITYKKQGYEKGTGAAIRGIKSDLDVLIIYGDSIIEKNDLEKIIHLNGYGVLAKKVEDPSKYGIFKIDTDNNISEIVEKPDSYIGNLANIGGFKMNSKILDIIYNIPLSKRGEYELTDAVNEYVKRFPFKAIEIKGAFIDIGYPWDILTANKHFLDKLTESQIGGTIEEGVTIKGNIILEEGALLKSGTYIEGNVYIGKGAQIGPNTYLRGSTVIGDNCKIGNAVEVKNSSFGDNTNAAHLSYIGDSIIGNNVNIGGGFSSANLRHDNKNIKVPVKGELTDTGMRKLGAIIGDNVKTGINTSTMPGRVIENGSYTMPGEIVK